MYDGRGSPLVGGLCDPRMSWDGSRALVTLKRMPVNRLAAMLCQLPSLCTRQLSWRLRTSGLGWAVQGKETEGEGVGGDYGRELGLSLSHSPSLCV